MTMTSTPRALLLPPFSLAVARRLARLAAMLVLLAGTALGALAQEADPPGRVAYLNHRQGTVSVSPSGDDSW